MQKRYTPILHGRTAPRAMKTRPLTQNKKRPSTFSFSNLYLVIGCLLMGNFALAQCDYTIELTDSYGDGWNGGTIDILVNGSVVLDDVTISDGVSASFPFTVNNSDDVTTVYTAGSYSYENGYRILDSDNNEIFASNYGTASGPPSDVASGTITGSCPPCPAPGNLQLVETTTTEASLAFDASSNESNGYAWVLMPSGGDPDTGTPEASGTLANGDPTEATAAVNPDSAYDFYVKADCGATDGESSWAGPVSITTPIIGVTIDVTGYNADVIANGVGTMESSTTNDVDGVNYCFLSEDWKLTGGNTDLGYGLPLSGTIASGDIEGLTYQLRPYGENNSLRIETAGVPNTLTLNAPSSFKSLYLLTTSGSGSASADVEVHFADETSETFSGNTIPDWFYSTALPVEASGFGRGNLSNDDDESFPDDPRLYRLALNLDEANHNKLVESITVTKNSGGVINLFAVSGSVISSTSNVIWTGASDNDWANASNWDGGAVPGPTDNVVIPNGVPNMPDATVAVDVSNITLASGATFIVTPGNTVTGTMNVERDIVDTNYHLVSVPVTGYDTGDYLTTYGSMLSTGDVDPANLGFASYNTADDTWSYAQAGDAGAWASGTGFATQFTATETVSYSGGFTNADVDVPLDVTGNGFNLVGNPYTSHLSSIGFTTDADLEEATVWLWNGSQYVTLNSVEGDFDIAPGQGFFVKAVNGDDGNLNIGYFTDHDGGTFYKTTTNPTLIKLVLNLSNGSMQTDARIYLLDDATTAFDNGKDGSMFTGSMPELGVYTRSVADDVDKKLAVQALPNGEFDEMVIPVGVIAPEGGDLTFALSTVQNLPDNINVYLEDTVTGSMTLLNDGGEYQVTLGSGEDGEGRFFINLSNATFSVDGVGGNGPRMMLVDGNRLLISKMESNATLTVYNLLGQAVWTQGVEAQNKQYAELNLSTGAYIAKLEGNGVQATKKIVINH